jgi:hypothetical protein
MGNEENFEEIYFFLFDLTLLYIIVCEYIHFV